MRVFSRSPTKIHAIFYFLFVSMFVKYCVILKIIQRLPTMLRIGSKTLTWRTDKTLHDFGPKVPLQPHCQVHPTAAFLKWLYSFIFVMALLTCGLLFTPLPGTFFLYLLLAYFVSSRSRFWKMFWEACSDSILSPGVMFPRYALRLPCICAVAFITQWVVRCDQIARLSAFPTKPL